LSGIDTGDATEGADWDLEIFGLNYDSILAGTGNIMGLNMSADTSDFQLGDTQTISLGLTFGTDQFFQAVNPAFFGLESTTPTFASLTPFGGSTENLLALPANTLFSAGVYTLFMGGEITTVDSSTGLAAQFVAIPEPSVLAFVLIGMILCTKAFRARKR
jgi:hypothetical protein